MSGPRCNSAVEHGPHWSGSSLEPSVWCEGRDLNVPHTVRPAVPVPDGATPPLTLRPDERADAD